MRKTISQLAIILALIAILIPIISSNAQYPLATQVIVTPATIDQPIDAQFTVTVTISEVVDLAGFDVKLGWDPAILRFVSRTATPQNVLNPMVFTVTDANDTAAGTYQLAAATLGGAPFTGTGVIYTVTLKVLAVGFSDIKFLLHDLADPIPNPIAHIAVNATFDNRPVVVQHQLTISMTGSGTTDPAVGSYMYNEGTVVEVTATPDSGWTFDHWLLDAANAGSANPYSVTMNTDHTLEAVFVPVQYDLTITVTGMGTTTPTPGTHPYNAGTVVGVTATPNSGWTFDHWVLDSVNVGSANPYSVTMNTDHALEAVFAPVQYQLTISVTGTGTTSPAVGSHMYNAGTVVPVTATPGGGWTFDHWLLDSVNVGSANPYSVTMNTNHALEAVFVALPPPQYDLTITVTGSGTTTPAVGTHTYDEGTVVQVTATPTSGWMLDHWVLDTVNVGSVNPYSVTMNADHALEAVFVVIPPVQYDLTITVTGSGTTTPAVGTYSYDAGTVVDVTAVPNSGWTFDHWMLDTVNIGATNPYSVTMNSDHTIEAVFVEIPVQYELTISVTGSGTTDPAVGSHMYDEGTVVPVTAFPTSGWSLDHWLLDSVNVGATNPYSVTMNADHTLEAVFVEVPPVQYDLTISVTGMGTTSPAVGTHTYDAGTVVPVTATPDSGWIFDHWELDTVNVGSANPYSVTMDADHALTAVFIGAPPIQYELTISVTGSGTTIPAVGSHTYDADTVVDVTAVPDSGWMFDHWVLDTVDVGSTNPYSVTMDADHALTAVFVEIPTVQHELTISVTGMGTTTPAPGSHMYDEGTVVPVTATPDSGWMLDHWELDTIDVGAANPYSVTMNSDHTLAAIFVEIPTVQYKLTISVMGMGTTTPAPGSYWYDQGTIVPVTATPASGWKFDHWVLNSVNVGSANPYSVTMNKCHTLKAVFVPCPTKEGKSPGYWKHQLNVYLGTGLGKAQESLSNLETWAALINQYYGMTPPTFNGYKLPPVSSMDADGDGIFELQDAYTILWNKQNYKDAWLGVAQWFNWASGRRPYYEA